MPRPKKCRMVDAVPGVRLFKPQGIPARQLAEIYLPFEGYEALRLADLEGLRQDDAAERMNVSRQTFGRILADARKSVTEAVVKGLVLRIEGGEYRTADGGVGPFAACQDLDPPSPDPTPDSDGRRDSSSSTPTPWRASTWATPPRREWPRAPASRRPSS